MARKAGRTPEETRRVLLEAAAVVFRERGLSASLDEIARRAGVSKGGLLYHFAAKEDLVRALANDVLDDLRAMVFAEIDPEDSAPGALARAYIRTCLAVTPDDEAAIRETVHLLAQLTVMPDVVELMRTDSQRWHDDLRADGMPDHVRTLVINAVDGASMSPFYGGALSEDDLNTLKRQLLRFTLHSELWDALSPDTAASSSH
jgi:AcrR family transcriptional regulator